MHYVSPATTAQCTCAHCIWSFALEAYALADLPELMGPSDGEECPGRCAAVQKELRHVLGLAETTSLCEWVIGDLVDCSDSWTTPCHAVCSCMQCLFFCVFPPERGDYLCVFCGL